MIYSVNFVDMAEKINYFAFCKYLQNTGWRTIVTKRTSTKIFQIQCNSNLYQITIPIDKSLVDFKIAMYNAVETLALVENKSIEQVMLYLLNPNTDIIKIRLDKKDVETGNILFDDAIKLYDNAKKLLAATALDILNPNKLHCGRLDDVVQKFLAQCRFGQTEIGSYVVSLVCPFAEINEEDGYKQLSLFSDEEKCANSLTRQVTNKLFANIYTIKSIIDSGKEQSFADDYNSHNISANFLEALNGLNLDSEETLVEFKAEWSPVVKKNQFELSDISITNDYYQPISAIIDKMKEQTPSTKEIVGRIKKLEAFPVADERKTGNVTISYIDDDSKSHTVKTTLEKLDYDKAIEAHQIGKYVKAVGEINQSGRKLTLICSSFSIID